MKSFAFLPRTVPLTNLKMLLGQTESDDSLFIYTLPLATGLLYTYCIILYIAYLYFVLVRNVPIDIFVWQKASVPPFVWVLHPLSNSALNTISCVTGFCHESRCSTQETVVFLRSFRSWGRIATEMYGHLQTMPFLWSSFGCIYHELRMDIYRFEVTNPPLKKETSGPEDNWATIPY